jgi:hypothetical protein
MVAKKSFIVIEEEPNQDKNRKTKTYEIKSRRTGEVLGHIFWYGAWRQYIFTTPEEIAWSIGCLQEVMAFLEMLSETRKKAKSFKSEK